MNSGFLLPLLQVGLFLAFLVSFDIRMIYRRIDKKWKNTIIETDFNEFLKPIKK